MRRTFSAEQVQFDLITAYYFRNDKHGSNEDKRKKAVEIISKYIDTELTETQQTYIKEYFFNGDTQKTIAERHGVNPSSVSRVMKNGLKKIKHIGRYIELR